MSVIVADNAKLVLKSFAAIFQNNLITKDLVTFKKFDKEYDPSNALRVVENIGPRYAVTRTTNGVANLSTGVQASVFGSEQYAITDTFSSSMGYGDFAAIRDMGDARRSVALKNAAMNMCEQIDAYILNFATLASNNWTGTPGTAISNFDHVANGYTRLKEEGSPDTELRAVLNYSDRQALASAIVAGTGNSALPDIGSGIYRSGFEGTVAGIPTAFTQQLPRFVSGTRTNGTVNGAAQNVNYSAVSISSAPGNYMTQTFNINGLGANATIRDGEVFTVAGVFAYDNRLQASLAPRLQQFRVINDTVADGTGAASVRIFPAMIVPGSGAGTDISVNTANATVNAAPAGAAVVTWATAASSTTAPRLILNKESIVVSTADLMMPSTGEAERVKLDNLPISIRMWKNSVFDTGAHNIRFDVALTAGTGDRRRIVRING